MASTDGNLDGYCECGGGGCAGFSILLSEGSIEACSKESFMVGA